MQFFPKYFIFDMVKIKHTDIDYRTLRISSSRGSGLCVEFQV